MGSLHHHSVGRPATSTASRSKGQCVPSQLSLPRCWAPAAPFTSDVSPHHAHIHRRPRRAPVWATAVPPLQQQQQGSAEAAKPERGQGRMTYKPASFAEMVKDAVKSCQDAIGTGLTRLEVEFPPLPIKLDGYKGASDTFIDSNIQLSLAAARQMAEAGRKVHVLMPDQGEYDRAYKLFKSSLDVMGVQVTMGHLKEIGGWNFSVEGMFNGYAPESRALGEQADTFIVINATCVELLNVREYVKQRAPEGSGKVVILWNLELDSLRGDMGLPAFPSKDVHYDFLATFRPVFFLRPRDYSKSVTVAPFLINYSGALFREFPGPWQVMLRQDNGEYACIAEDRVRYNLGELKEELQAAMGLNTEEEGSAMQVLRRGIKNSTWWEDDYEKEKSHEWRL